MSEIDHHGGRDQAPGDEPHESAGAYVFNSLVGLGLASLLTIGSFGVVMTHLLWAPAVGVALIVLAIAQMGVPIVRSAEPDLFHCSSPMRSGLAR